MVNASREGRFYEFFGCATNSNVQPVSRIVFEDEIIELGAAKASIYNISNYLNNKMTSIMSGPADHPWITSF